jgi:error-prone DNA polymerase
MGKKLTPPRYAELQVTTNFSFLRGASHGEELVAQAHALGLEAIAVTDRNTLAGVVRAHLSAKELGLKLIVGARLDLQDAPSLLCLPRDRQAYGRLSRLLSLGQMRAKKGACTLYLDDVAAHADGQIFIVLPPDDWDWREATTTATSPTAAVIPFRRSPSPHARGHGERECVRRAAAAHQGGAGRSESLSRSEPHLSRRRPGAHRGAE